ncbi:MAG: DNA-processing protein DprA [Lapillicoccus sp.]
MTDATPVSEAERRARVAWSRIAEPGDERAVGLVATFGAQEALADVMAGSPSLPEVFRLRAERLEVERDLAIAARVGARVVCPGDPDWPTGVNDLTAPPFCLWVRGPGLLADLARRSLAIIGARASTRYGEGVASDLAAGLADRGYGVVSGAAFGIDAAAHRGALAVDGFTVAVLAGGIERAYPVAHTRLIEVIASSGAVISEVPPGSAPTKPRFLLRNRLIAAMTTGTVVVEAGLRSGSLNTARTAFALGRPVGVVPGPVTSMVSAGCHEAARDAMAVIVTDVPEVVDLVGAYGADAAPRLRGAERPDDHLDPLDAQVLAAVPYRKAIDAGSVARAGGLAPLAVAASLPRLELVGLVVRVGDGWKKVPDRAPAG